MTALDLFGDPSPPPAKNSPGYLQHLAQLDYADGATFWALAHQTRRLPPGLNPAEHETVWLRTTRGQMRHVVINIATGQISEVP